MEKKSAYERPKMVDWYDPLQLLSTAGKTAISTIIGEYADPRTGLKEPIRGKFFDYSKELVRTEFDFEALKDTRRNEIWIDYAADLGDGWNSTYAVAYYLAQKEIKIEINQNKKLLKRGEVLILGGDAVYPTASLDEYEKRLVTPYRMAFKASGTGQTEMLKEQITLGEDPHVFAIPGNHDWYDSLVSFKKLFCSHVFNDRKFAGDKQTGQGGWRTRQKRSYFAIKLPHNWWLLGVDLQLSHNIDVSQLQYFESVVEQMSEGDQVILCVPEPYWVKAIKYQNITDKYEEKEQSIEKLEKLFESNKVKIEVYVAGDLHHYRRFEDEFKVQKITAGGGGAFLHPTHDFDFKKQNEDQTKGFLLKKDFPDFKESRRQDWKNLWFPARNKSFGVVTMIIYTLLAWFIYAGIENRPNWVTDFESKFYNFISEPSTILSVLWSFLNGAWETTAARLIREPVAVLIVLLMQSGLIFFTDSHSTVYRRIAGFVHGLTHLFAAFVAGWASYLVGVIIIENFNTQNSLSVYFLIWMACFIAFAASAWAIGSFIMGLYLFVSLHIFGRHDNEAFSALKIEDYKNFLRLHVDAEGRLTIFPLKIEKVPRMWRPVLTDNKINYYAPANGNIPVLIEEPISINKFV